MKPKTDEEAVVHYFNDNDQFVFESFTKAVEEMCKPVVLIYGPSGNMPAISHLTVQDAGKTTFMANITANSFKGKELVYVNWNKLGTDKKDNLGHHLKGIAIVVFIVPLYGSDSGKASGKLLG